MGMVIYSMNSTLIVHKDPFIACKGFKWLHVFNRMGNFSYGIFLIHFPIIQIFIHYGLDRYSFILTLALTTILSTGLGMLSWKYIEKPCLYHPKKKA